MTLTSWIFGVLVALGLKDPTPRHQLVWWDLSASRSAELQRDVAWLRGALDSLVPGSQMVILPVHGGTNAAPMLTISLSARNGQPHLAYQRNLHRERHHARQALEELVRRAMTDTSLARQETRLLDALDLTPHLAQALTAGQEGKVRVSFLTDGIEDSDRGRFMRKIPTTTPKIVPLHGLEVQMLGVQGAADARTTMALRAWWSDALQRAGAQCVGACVPLL